MSRTELGRKLWLQRKKILNSGIPLVDEERREIWTMAKQTVRNFSNPGLTHYGYKLGSKRYPFHRTPKGDIFLVAANKPYWLARRRSDNRLIGGEGFTYEDAMAALEYRPLK